MKSALSALGARTGAPSISWLMQLTLSRPKLISLAAGFTDNASLPVAETRQLVEHILSSRRSGEVALQYGSTAGDPELRRLTAARLRQQDGVGADDAVYSPERVVMTHGSQQLLYILAEALCDPGDIVLVEDPTYFVFLGIAQSHGLRCRGVRLTPNGIDLAHLETVLEELKQAGELPRVKMLYLVTYFQNPTGYTTSLETKAAALQLLRRYEKAAGHPLYLLEDAAYRELRFAGDDIPTALTVKGAQERVLYTSTYSKPFATGVRVGYGVLPEPVLTAVTRIKGNHDFGTAHLLQKILTAALVSGTYERHLVRLRQRYASKVAVMTEAIEAHFPETVKWERPTGGLYVWAGLSAKFSAGVKSALFQQALENDVLYVPGELCYADDASRRKPKHEMRISYGNASEPSIREGIRRLGHALRQVKK